MGSISVANHSAAQTFLGHSDPGVLGKNRFSVGLAWDVWGCLGFLSI